MPQSSSMQRKMARLKENIIAAREAGMEVWDIAKQCKCSPGTVKKILFNGAIKAERLQRFNEALVSRGPRGVAVIDEWLSKGSLEAAKWLLENIGAVSKEQIKQLTINATNAQVNLSNDTLEAAKAVAALMKAAELKQLPPVLVIGTQSNNEENNGTDILSEEVLPGTEPTSDDSQGG